MTFRDKLRRFLATTKMITLRTLGGLAMLVVFVICAFGAMRIAIHGREVIVPSLANLSDTDAAIAAKKLGLNLSVENRFYAATIPANHVLSQSPLPGSSVRRGGQIRVTESLGTQQVPVPDVTGQDEHPATLMLKRLQLELGTVAHIPGPGPTGVVLAQSPPPNVAGLDGPHVAILVADDEDAPASVGYVMPSIVGLTVATAQSRLGSAGLHIALPTAQEAPNVPELPPLDLSAGLPPDPAIPPTIAPPPVLSTSIITSQSPLPGHRVSRADNIHITVTNSTPSP
jgi:beta-lactam-binding protein with PASTA domain